MVVKKAIAMPALQTFAAANSLGILVYERSSYPAGYICRIAERSMFYIVLFGMNGSFRLVDGETSNGQTGRI